MTLMEDDLKTHLIALELRLQDSSTRKDPAAIGELLSEDFREFGASGIVWDRATLLETLSAEPPTRSPAKTSSANASPATWRCSPTSPPTRPAKPSAAPSGASKETAGESSSTRARSFCPNHLNSCHLGKTTQCRRTTPPSSAASSKKSSTRAASTPPCSSSGKTSSSRFPCPARVQASKA